MSNPAGRPRRSELSTEDLSVGQRPVIDLDERLLDHESESIVAIDKPLSISYIDALAFNEQRVTIRIHPSTEKNAPKVAECWVNGEAAEIWVNNRWVKIGYMPIGQVLITKRKYVEVLARAKHDTVSTEVLKSAEDEKNLAHRVTSVRYSFSVVQDNDPRGVDWLTRLLSEG